MKKHYETHVEDTDKLISVAGPELDYKSWYEQYRKLMEEQARGVGGYKLNWGDSNIWSNYITRGIFGTGEVTDNTIHITSAKTNNSLFETRASLKSVEYKVLIKGLTDDIYLHYGVFNDGKELWTEIKNDGIYTLPSYDYDSRYNMKWKVMSQTYPIDCNITIEQLPLYPGALVFDGVDDYGVCDNFPIPILALNVLNEEITKEINTYDLTPGEALQVKDHYPEWVAGITVKVGERYSSDNILWECIKEHTTQDNWKPSMATASLWKVVDEEHKGTIDDPIVYIPPMEIFKDKYYIQNGVKYKCTRNSEQPLTHDLSALVGLYVETI